VFGQGSGKPWQEHAGVTGVGLKPVAKLFCEPALFFAGFQEKCREADGDG
jgi:hypothetical protein